MGRWFFKKSEKPEKHKRFYFVFYDINKIMLGGLYYYFSASNRFLYLGFRQKKRKKLFINLNSNKHVIYRHYFIYWLFLKNLLHFKASAINKQYFFFLHSKVLFPYCFIDYCCCFHFISSFSSSQSRRSFHLYHHHHLLLLYFFFIGFNN